MVRCRCLDKPTAKNDLHPKKGTTKHLMEQKEIGLLRTAAYKYYYSKGLFRLIKLIK